METEKVEKCFHDVFGKPAAPNTPKIISDQWGVVELFGHARIAGKISEQTLGGCAFVRVDVPAIGKEQAFTKLFGQGAIYAISFTDETTARMVAEGCAPRPVNTWELSQALKALPASSQQNRPSEMEQDDYEEPEPIMPGGSELTP